MLISKPLKTFWQAPLDDMLKYLELLSDRRDEGSLRTTNGMDDYSCFSRAASTTDTDISEAINQSYLARLPGSVGACSSFSYPRFGY